MTRCKTYHILGANNPVDPSLQTKNLEFIVLNPAKKILCMLPAIILLTGLKVAVIIDANESKRS